MVNCMVILSIAPNTGVSLRDALMRKFRATVPFGRPRP